MNASETISVVGAGLAGSEATSAILDAESIERTSVFRASRYNEGGWADYRNRPSGRHHYQPMHVNWGLVPALGRRVSGKSARCAAYVCRATTNLHAWLESHALMPANCEVTDTCEGVSSV